MVNPDELRSDILDQGCGVDGSSTDAASSHLNYLEENFVGGLWGREDFFINLHNLSNREKQIVKDVKLFFTIIEMAGEMPLIQ